MYKLITRKGRLNKVHCFTIVSEWHLIRVVTVYVAAIPLVESRIIYNNLEHSLNNKSRLMILLKYKDIQDEVKKMAFHCVLLVIHYTVLQRVRVNVYFVVIIIF